jgi:hypothetical protein
MATVTSGYTFVNNETVTPAKLNSLAGSATVSAIVNADIDAAAAIADSKLATISTAGKVANSATTAASANTASAIVARDVSGNFSAGAVTASALSTTGNVSVGGNLIPTWLAKSTTYTAAAGDMVATNTSSAPWTLTLPASPATGTQIKVSDASRSWDSKNLTIARNGSTIEGLSENLTCDAVGSLIVLFYNGSTWRVLH